MSSIKQDLVAIIGQGYVGLPLGMEVVHAGWKVVGIDVSVERVDQIIAGISPIEDVSNEELKSALAIGYEVTSDFARLQEARIIVICVPTPLTDDDLPDLTPLSRACQEIANFASSDALVINESTSFPGTLRNFIPATIQDHNPGLLLEFAAAPERVDPANSNWNFKNTPRLVGGLTEEASIRAINFYSSFCEKVFRVSSPEVAEMSKLLENAFRQVNIALVNQVAQLTEKLGISMAEVVDAASSKPYGYMPFRPGVGVGGHCIPVDPMYLAWFAQQEGIDLSIVNVAQEINDNTPSKVVSRLKSIGLAQDSKVLVIGMSYKSRVSDLRESPSLVLLDLLDKVFSKVEWWDPLVVGLVGRPKSKLIGKFDCVVVIHSGDAEEVQEAIESAVHILDFSGQINKSNGQVIRI